MNLIHRPASKMCRRLISLLLCYSLLHVTLPVLAMARGLRALLPQLTQDGPAPRSGPPEGSFPNLDEVKSRQPSRPRAPQGVPSTARSKRNPLNPRTTGLVGPPRPLPSPTPSRQRLPVQIPVPSPSVRIANTITVNQLANQFDTTLTAQNGGFRRSLINNLIAYNSMFPTFSLNGGAQVVDGLLATVFSQLVTPDATKNLATFAFLPPPQGGSPYGGNAVSIPGTIENEHFDNGGEGVGYHDTSSGSHGQDYDQPPSYPPPSFRQPTDVDIYKQQAAYSNGYLIVMQAGDWMNYTINVTQTNSNYVLEARTWYWGAVGGTFHVEVDNANVSGSLQIPGGPGWKTLIVNGISLTAGQHILRVVCDANGSDGSYMGDIDFVTLRLPGGTPYGGSPAAIPGTLEIEHYNEGAAETAYHDTTAGSHGQDYDQPNYPTPSFRQPTNVDIYKQQVGYSNGYLVLGQAGDWTNYAVNVATTGSYIIEAQVAWGGISGSPGTFHLEFDGVNKTGPMQIPDTNWYFATVIKTGVQLNAGQHVMRVVWDTNASNGYSGDIDKITFTSQTAPSTNQFLQNFLQATLLRPPSTVEATYWTDIMQAAYANGQGSLHLSLRELGRTVFESADYAARQRDNHWYVYDLYRSYLMREPDTSGWLFWEGQLAGSNPLSREELRRIFEDCGEFTGLVGTLTSNGSASTSVSSLASARVDPFNQPGNGLASRDAQWGVSLLSLPGRAGLDLGLSLSYSSMVWTRSGPNVYFDEDNGSPSPGFRIGFPTIQERVFDAQAGRNVYLLISGGSRVSLRQLGTSNIYEAADSSYLQLVDNGGSLLVRTTDGTQLSYQFLNSEWRCGQIKDRNGNYLTVNYNWLGQITTVVDTVNRTITFDYDTNANLQRIKQTWAGQTSPHEWATFGWSDVSINPSFSGVTVVGASNPSTIPMLAQVGLDDGSRYNFEYNATAQVSLISRTTSDNVPRSATAYEYQSIANDCPRLSKTRLSADDWTGIGDVPVEVVTEYNDPGNGSHTMTAPDGTIFKEFYGTGRQRGLTTQTEVWSEGVRQKWTTTIWAQDTSGVNYATNPNCPTNPRITETNVYDADENRRRTTVDYGPSLPLPSGTSCSLPRDMREYAANANTVLRLTQIDYRMDAVADAAYLSRRIIGLVKEQRLYEGDEGALMSRVAFGYDETNIEGNDAPVSHDNSYGSNLVSGRANLTSVSRYNVDNTSQSTVSRMKYNTAGAVVETTDPRDHHTTVSYADSFSANGIDPDAPRPFSTFAFPTTVTDADNHSSLVRYHYDLGAKTRVQGPPPEGPEGIQPQGMIKIYAYDDSARIERVTTTNNGAYQRFEYGPDYVKSFATVKNIADQAFSSTVFDGMGRTVFAASNHPYSIGGYSAVHTVYDRMGRPVKQSNPTETNDEWAPVGDDEAGWVYTTQTYDWKNRPLRTTHPDGKFKEAAYSGCGCAGGEVVTLTDEGTRLGMGASAVVKKRQQKIYSDMLGRTVKSEMLNWQGGSPYATTINNYNARDQLTLSRQFDTAQGTVPLNLTDLSCPDGSCQKTIMSYDGYGRLETRHLPEQQVDPGNSSSTDHTTWEYYDDDTVKKVTDARGAYQTFEYNSRHLLTEIAYEPSAGVADVPTVNFEYDSAGNRKLMSDGLGSVTYAYDQLSRLKKETRTFTGFGAFPLIYDYNFANELISVNDQAFSTTVDYGYDVAGRLEEVTGVGYPNASEFTSEMQYRASGSLAAMNFGNGKTLSIGYNTRLMPSSYTIPGVVNKNYEYYADGRVDYSQDVNDARYDRKNQYDHVGSLTSALSGEEARIVTLTDDRPYNQSYQHTVWGNMTVRTGKQWARPEVTEPASYSNNRRVGWNYDASGNWLDEGTYNALERKYDAAGRLAKIIHPAYPTNPKRTDDYDGDGQRVRSGYHRLGCSPEYYCAFDYTYYLRSSVLGGQIVTEIRDNGQKSMGYVYYPSGGVIAVQKLTTPEDNGVYLLWRHADAANFSVRATDTGGSSNGYFQERYNAELDALGADNALADPGPPELSSPPDDFGTGWLLPSSAMSRCKFNGMPIDCDELKDKIDTGNAEMEISTGTGRPTNIPIESYGMGMYRNWVANNGTKVKDPGNEPIGTTTDPDGNEVPIYGTATNEDELGHYELASFFFRGTPVQKQTAGGKRVRPVVKLNSCEQFAQSLADHLYNHTVKYGTPYRALSVDDRTLTRIGVMMQKQAIDNVDFSGKPYVKGQTPIDGFQPQLVAHGQDADVYHHIIFTAGSVLDADWGPQMNAAFLLHDQMQARRRKESETEVLDDYAGMLVGEKMLIMGRLGKQADFAYLAKQIANILCL